MITPRQIPLLLGGLASGVALFATVRTLRLNQIQTEYLVPFDGWPFLSKLQAGESAVALLSHNVHLFAVPQLLFWLDLDLSHGSLRFLHGATLAFSLASLAAMAAIVVRADALRGAAWVTICSLMLCTGIWLSQSNQNTFAYPLLDVMASFTVLAIVGMALIGGRLHDGNATVWFPALALVAVAGFYAVEVFAAALLCVLGEAIVRRNRRVGLLVAALTILLFLSYWTFRPPLVQAQHGEGAFSLPVSLRNVLILLSGHVMYLLLAHQHPRSVANGAAIGMSCLQLTYAGWVVVLLCRRRRSPNGVDRLGLSLIVFAIVAIGSAVWLRFGTAPLGGPVLRYTWYAALLSIGSVLLAGNGLAPGSSRWDAIVAGVVVSTLAAYCLADMCVQNAGERWPRVRGEMSIYALHPGYEKDLGPVSTEAGAEVREKLHPFLKRERLFSFGSSAYRLVGGRFAGQRLEWQDCRIEAESMEQRKDRVLSHISLSGIAAKRNSAFLLVGDDSTVEAFSHAERADWRSDTVGARFLGDREKRRAKLIYVEDVTEPALRYTECERR
jgi:hypothetical protein